MIELESWVPRSHKLDAAAKGQEEPRGRLSEESTGEGPIWRSFYLTSGHKESVLGKLPGVLFCWPIAFVSPTGGYR